VSEIRKYDVKRDWEYIAHCFRLNHVIRWQIQKGYDGDLMFIETEADNMLNESARAVMRDIPDLEADR